MGSITVGIKEKEIEIVGYDRSLISPRLTPWGCRHLLELFRGVSNRTENLMKKSTLKFWTMRERETSGKKITLLPLVLSLVLVLFPLSLSAQNAKTILEKADTIFHLDKVYSESELLITRSGQDQAPQILKNYSLNDSDGTARSLALFEAPARVKGTAYLTIGNDLWIRFASTGRTRKLSSSSKKNSAGGSDFSYIDTGDGDLSYSNLYTPTLDGTEDVNGVSSYRLVLKPLSGKDGTYEKLRIWISESDNNYQKIEFWEDGVAIKEMTLSDYRDNDGLSYPFLITMTSLTKNSVSRIKTTLFEIDSSRIQERFFSTRYLDGL